MGQIRRPNYPLYRKIMLAAGTPFYKAIKLSSALVNGVQIQWHDATSNFTVTLYTSLLENPTVPADGAAGPALEQWHDESGSVTITGGAASAAGCDVLHLGNNGAKWALFKFDVTGNSLVSMLTHGKE